MSLIGDTVLLKTPMNPGTGYGKDGILMTETMVDMGVDLHLEPLHVGLPLPVKTASLFTKERPSHFDVAINHEFPGAIGFPEIMPQHADKIIGWTMFEFLKFGPDNEMTENLRERLEVFDLVLAYDKVSASALSEYMTDQDRLEILQGGYDAEFWKPNEEEYASREWDSTFRFCMNGTMNQRKNAWASIWAFKSLKDEYGDEFDAELHLKTTSLIFPPQMEGWCPGLRIHFANWAATDLRKFYLKMNCLLAPSWGEGKNLPALEAQTMGIPVIVTGFGGHLEWGHEDWAYLVYGPIEEHSPEMGSMRIDADTMREKMWHVYNNRVEAKMKGDLASKVIPQQCDWSKVMERLRLKIDNIKPR